MITLTITDTQDSATFRVFAVPIVSDPVIAETDVMAIDANLSTYVTGAKRQYSFDLGYLDAEAYAVLLGFRQRQYTNHKYPQITVEGAENINVTNMTGKMTLSEQRVIDNCGNVEDVTVTFRESKQMP